MSDALAQLRGTVVPISALLCSPPEGTARIQSLLRCDLAVSHTGSLTCQSAPDKLVPTSVMLDYYLWHRHSSQIGSGRVVLVTYSGMYQTSFQKVSTQSLFVSTAEFHNKCDHMCIFFKWCSCVMQS